jgi:Kef-type K+ transport system membrane component KefB
LLLTIPYLLVMFVVVYPWLHRYFRKDRDATKPAKDAWIWLGMIVSATVTEAIGIHAVFGAFLFGLLIPHDAPVAASLRSRMHDFAAILMVPLFFACTGLKTQFGLLANYQDWLICAAIIFVAIVGKVGGTALGARWANIDWRSSCLVGILMNTRGLMEVIVLNIGLEMGILSPALFAMFVLMALVTTMGTVPALQWMGQANAFETPTSVPPERAVDRMKLAGVSEWEHQHIK